MRSLNQIETTAKMAARETDTAFVRVEEGPLAYRVTYASRDGQRRATQSVNKQTAQHIRFSALLQIFVAYAANLMEQGQVH